MRSILLVMAGLTILVTVATAQQTRSKKLIEYGWDVRDISYIRQNIREMEKKPFDGVIFCLPGWTETASVFTKKKWDESKFEATFEDCRNIKWEKFTDNFVAVLSASNMDWFSDEDWEAVRHNVGLVAKAAALARCRGICFDPEPYGDNPWSYSSQSHAKEKSFNEYQEKVRQRGAEFLKAITQQFPKPVIHTFFQLSLFLEIMKESKSERRELLLSQHGYSLLPAFLNGMLDVADPDVLFTDGNESSYYYTSPADFQKSREMVKQKARVMIAPKNAHKYKRQMQMSHALYADFVFGYGIWGQRSSVAPMLTPENRAKWFEHNTYYALQSSDEFVWLYSEKMNWWTNTDLPSGMEQAVRSAREKIAKKQKLGFEMADLLKAAKEKKQAELKVKQLRRSAEISHLSAGDQPPVIDGRLDDSIWQKAQPLEAFVPYVAIGTETKAKTQAWVAYDDRSLYIAVRCSEPKKNEMRFVGTQHDDGVWEGDSIDVFLSPGKKPTPYIHLLLSPKNVQWDALFTDHNAMDFDPKWESAVAIGDNEWVAEYAIPWIELKMKTPVPGETHRANICRNRAPDSEQTAWSQTFDGFCEPESFGTWTFR